MKTTHDDTTSRERKQLLSRADLMQKGITHSRAHLYRLVAAGKFPAPVSIGPARSAWRSEDIEKWLAELPRANWKTSAA